MWIVFSQLVGVLLWATVLPMWFIEVQKQSRKWYFALLTGLVVFYGVPAIGGFFFVIQMLREYGVCLHIY